MDDPSTEAVHLGADDNENNSTEDVNNTSEPVTQVWEDDMSEEDVMKMTFHTMDDAESFYNMYAKCKGFGTRKQDIRKDQSGFIIMRFLVCAKEGFRSTNWIEREDRQREPRAETRTGCPAHFRVNFDKQSENFKVKAFFKEHNHDMLLPEHVPFLRSHRGITAAEVAHTRAMQEVGWRTSDILKFFAHQAGGYGKVGFTLKDLYNHVDSERRKEIKDGDAIGALGYLCAKQASDPSMVYEYDTDNEERLSRLLWCDSRSQSDYKSFGDVLVFDTTYRTNAYRKPLVILAGSNNHYQTTIFAVALLSDETEATYVWVLETFIAAMGGKLPISILTDGDNAMKNAIEKVCPTVRHRLCGWHIQRNAATNVQSKSFIDGFGKFVQHNYSIDGFERRWGEFVSECNVGENSWVQEIYKKRSKWAESYLRGHFWANMHSTQRCEGMNAFLKKFLDTQMRLYEFVRSFDLALAWIRNNEAKLEKETRDGDPVLSTHWRTFEKQINDLCTRTIFFIIRDELNAESMLVCDLLESDAQGTKVYEVTSYSQPNYAWKVVYNSNLLDFQCSCKTLETCGWPCSHLFSVMKKEKLQDFPRHCIKSRWMRDAKENTTAIGSGNGISSSVTQMTRYGVLNSKCNQMCYYGSLSDEGFHKLADVVTRLTDEMKVISEKYTMSSPDNLSSPPPPPTKKHCTNVRDPVWTKTKGCHGKGAGKTPHRCRGCRCIGHNITTCPKERAKRSGAMSNNVGGECSNTDNPLQQEATMDGSMGGNSHQRSRFHLSQASNSINTHDLEMSDGTNSNE